VRYTASVVNSWGPSVLVLPWAFPALPLALLFSSPFSRVVSPPLRLFLCLLPLTRARARHRSTWVFSRLYSVVNASISLRHQRAFHCYNRWLRGLFFVRSHGPHPVQKFSMEINTRFVWRCFLSDCCLSQSLGYRLEVLRAARVIITGLQDLQQIQSPLR